MISFDFITPLARPALPRGSLLPRIIRPRVTVSCIVGLFCLRISLLLGLFCLLISLLLGLPGRKPLVTRHRAPHNTRRAQRSSSSARPLCTRLGSGSGAHLCVCVCVCVCYGNVTAAKSSPLGSDILWKGGLGGRRRRRKVGRASGAPLPFQHHTWHGRCDAMCGLALAVNGCLCPLSTPAP